MNAIEQNPIHGISQPTEADPSTEITALTEAEPAELQHEHDPRVIALSDFVSEFGASLLEAVARQNPPVYDGTPNPFRREVMERLRRKPYFAQQDAVQALCALLLDTKERAAILNAEMGTGKTMMAIAVAAVLHAEGYKRTLVISPPHLVYKWRREILETVPNATVWILNGPDTLRKLLQFRDLLGMRKPTGPEFFVLGRVRMRMDYHWRPSTATRTVYERRHLIDNDEFSPTRLFSIKASCCPRCGTVVTTPEREPVPAGGVPDDKRYACNACNEPLWTLTRPKGTTKTQRETVLDALVKLPMIGLKTAERLLNNFGEDVLAAMLIDNVHEFINLMDEEGNLVFSDRQAQRMERAFARTEFSFGQGGYQATEFIKRYLPADTFDLLVVDEGHEYKNDGSAQGQAMGVLANKVRKVLLLTGTLMGGYADDLFFLLFRIMPARMIEDGFRCSKQGSLGAAAMAFLRQHGILKDIYKESESASHRTARGKKMTVRTVKAAGFGPKGLTRYVLPFTVFLKLKDIGQNVLPPYREYYHEVGMTDEMTQRYTEMSSVLTTLLRAALRNRDNSLLGVVMNVLLAWPDCCFRPETVKHPRTRQLLHFVPSVLDESLPSPKEEKLIALCKAAKAQGRCTLVYSVYTGTRDTASRLAALLKAEGLKAAVMRAAVPSGEREDWFKDQVQAGIDVVICNPELVKTGLDLLDFPTIVFMQTGFNVYTLLQASRRSWRIGQKQAVEVHFLGYEKSAQLSCLALMAKKIAVSQSTSGDMPDTGLDSLDDDGDSIEVALAKQLVG